MLHSSGAGVGVSPGLQRNLANANHAEKTEMPAECVDSL